MQSSGIHDACVLMALIGIRGLLQLVVDCSCDARGRNQYDTTEATGTRKICACRESNPGHKHGRLV